MPSRTARHRPLPGAASLATFGFGFAAVALVLAADSRQPAAADNETRTLTIYHTHTRENITVTFKRNGRYDESGLAKLNHFLRDWRNDEATKMDPRLFDVVWEVYRDVGANQPVQIISAYHSPQTNAMLRRRSRGVAQFSQHMLGKAMDFNIPGVSLERVRNAGLRQQRGGVGFYPSSGSPFVHVDVGSVRHWPRLSPEALARVFPDGRTVHLPSDGRPLPGYELALADVARRGASPSRVAVASASVSADEGMESAPARGKSRRGWFSRWFSGGNDDDEEETRQAAPSRGRPKAEPRATQVAAAVPMPRARPSAEGAGVAVASAPVTASQIVAARGLWQATETIAAADATPIRSAVAAPPVRPAAEAPRMMWQVGPQPVVVASADSTAVAKRVPAPRPRPEVAQASAADPTTTAAVPWPIGGREDRVPSDLVLAYAASPPAETGARPAAPMGSLKPSAAASARRPQPQPARAAAPGRPAARQLAENPWLRGIILASRMHEAMSVTVLGPPNYLTLTPLMHKPPSAVANAFAEDPEFGLAATAFSGPAVGSIQLVTFGTVTAVLN